MVTWMKTFLHIFVLLINDKPGDICKGVQLLCHVVHPPFRLNINKVPHSDAPAQKHPYIVLDGEASKCVVVVAEEVPQSSVNSIIPTYLI